jgi:conjugative transposon TraN protein
MNFLNNLFIRILLWGFLANWALDAKGQPVNESQHVEITYNKTSSIIFPTVITSVDRGSRDILAQKAKGVGNVLQLKASRENFPETNLTVITADGMLNHFKVNYSSQPESLTINMGEREPSKSPLIFQTEMTETDLQHYSSGIIQAKRTNLFIREKQYKMSLTLLGVFIKDDVMFYRFRIRNLSNISYDIDFLKFYVRDKAKIKRTASQEIQLKPIYTYGNDKVVKGKSETEIVFALPKFTIPESKQLDVEVFERNGGRHFDLVINNKIIVNAELLL